MAQRILTMVWCLLAAGCSADREPGELFGPSEAGILVVDGLLIVDEPLPTIYVSRTVAANGSIQAGEVRVPGAVVELRQGSQTYVYRSAGNDVDFLPSDTMVIRA